MHHFDGTAGQTEGHRPKGGLTSPVGDGIKCGPVEWNRLMLVQYLGNECDFLDTSEGCRNNIQRILQGTLRSNLAGQRNLSANLSYTSC